MESDPKLNLTVFSCGGDCVNISESDSDEVFSPPAANLNGGACGAGDRCSVALRALVRIKEGRKIGGLRLLSLNFDPSKGESWNASLGWRC